MQRKTKPWHSPEQPIKYGTVAVIQHLQNILEKTIVPSWISKPPAKFGEASAGSLTADEWRTMALVYLPLALVPLWGQGSQRPSPDIAEKYQHVLNHTMDLLAAVHLAGLHVVTPNRVAAYQEHMTNYVHNLPKLHPTIGLRPNYHMALHIPHFLQLFGPVKSWWCFPFERLVGILQRLPTNHKFGRSLHVLMLQILMTILFNNQEIWRRLYFIHS